MKKLLKKQGGFTLLELLIVIVIIGILALIIVPGLASGPKRARDAQRKSDLRAVKNALETYYNDKNVYPTGNWSGLSAFLSPDYLPTVPTDPKSGTTTPYVYGPNTGATKFVIEANLENNTDAQINDKNGAAGYNATYSTPNNYPNGYAVTSVN